MGCVKEDSEFEQVEIAHIIMGNDFRSMVPSMKRQFFSGTNQGNVLSPVELPPISNLWQLACKTKYELMGCHRKECGPLTKGEADPPGRGTKRKTP